MQAIKSKTSVMVVALSIVLITASNLLFAHQATGEELNAGGALSASAMHEQSVKSYFFDKDGNELPYQTDQAVVWVTDATKGEVSFDANTRTLTLDGVAATDITFRNMEGTIALKGTSSSKFGVTYEGPKLTIVGPGTLTSEVSTKGNLVMEGGAISVSGKYVAISCEGNFTMKGGSVSATSIKGVAIDVRNSEKTTCSLNMQGGTISISGSSVSGIAVQGGNFVMTGGKVSASKCKEDAIVVLKSTIVGAKKGGGKVAVKGGTLSASTSKPSEFAAISAASMVDDPACLKTIKGKLPKGATFKAGGNEYCITSPDSIPPQVILAKYGSSAKKATLGEFKYGSVKYGVEGVGANAFNTAQGAKVTSIVFKNLIRKIGADAFAGTKALTVLKLLNPGIDAKYGRSGVVSVKWIKGTSVAKKAFSKCGKVNGKKLTVWLTNMGVMDVDAAKYKKLLVKYGLPSKAKLKTFDRYSSPY